MKIVTTLSLTLLVTALALPGAIAAAEKVESLRGGTPIEGKSLPAEKAMTVEQDKPFPRTFVHQPPLIPHATDDQRISIEQNDCLDCHGMPDSGAPKPHASHYRDRDGKEPGGISQRWWFCTQCHVSQVEARPPVENTFKP